jgi:hypothetical protein
MDRKIACQFTIVLLTVGVVSLVQPTDASAASCAGVTHADSVTVDGTSLKLNGLGIREATVFQVDVYVAALYVPSTSNKTSELIDPSTKKKLVLSFVRGVDRSDIVSAYRESFKNAAGSDYSKLKGKLEKLNSWMTSVKDGQDQVYTYVPGEGVTVEVAGKTKGTISRGDFARYFFSIWLGDNPPNAGLKTGLLGGKCG